MLRLRQIVERIAFLIHLVDLIEQPQDLVTMRADVGSRGRSDGDLGGTVLSEDQKSLSHQMDVVNSSL